MCIEYLACVFDIHIRTSIGNGEHSALRRDEEVVCDEVVNLRQGREQVLDSIYHTCTYREKFQGISLVVFARIDG